MDGAPRHDVQLQRMEAHAEPDAAAAGGSNGAAGATAAAAQGAPHAAAPEAALHCNTSAPAADAPADAGAWRARQAREHGSGSTRAVSSPVVRCKLQAQA
jgi:hypothetical protein